MGRSVPLAPFGFPSDEGLKIDSCSVSRANPACPGKPAVRSVPLDLMRNPCWESRANAVPQTYAPELLTGPITQTGPTRERAILTQSPKLTLPSYSPGRLLRPGQLGSVPSKSRFSHGFPREPGLSRVRRKSTLSRVRRKSTLARFLARPC